MALAKVLTITTTKTDLFSSLASTGLYTVHIVKGDGYITNNSGAATSDSILLSSIPTSGNFLSFVWDSATPLYAFTSSGSGTLGYILSPIGSVGLSVNC